MTEWIYHADIYRAIRAHDGAASVPDIARYLERSQTGVRNVVRQSVDRGWLVELGMSSTGARCYGITREVKP